MDDSGQHYRKEQLDHLKALCDRTQNIHSQFMTINLFEIASKVFDAMGVENAKRLDKKGLEERGLQYVAAWVCFKFAMLHESTMTPRPSWKIDNEASKEKINKAIKHLDALIENIKQQATSSFYQGPDKDIDALEEVKSRQQNRLLSLKKNPPKNYAHNHLDRACSRAVKMASAFGLGTAAASVDSPIERMLAVVLNNVDKVLLNSKIEAARKRYQRREKKLSDKT